MHAFLICILTLHVGTVLSYIPAEAVNAFAMHPTDDILAAGTITGNLLLLSTSSSTVTEIATIAVGSKGVIGRMAWGPSSSHIALLIVYDHVEILHFSNLVTGEVDLTSVLLHTFPVSAIGWFPAGTVVLVGTANGYIDKYTLTGLSVILESSRDFRRFVGCEVTFLYPLTASYIYGCRSGRVGLYALASSTPTTVIELSSVQLRTSHAIFQPAGNYIVAMIKDEVFIVSVSDLSIYKQFTVYPYRLPRVRNSDRVMDFAVFVETGSPITLAVRTADGVFIYDMVAPSLGSWVTGLSLADMRASGSFVWSTVSTGWDSDPSDPQIRYDDVEDADGTIDFLPCWNAEAEFKQIGDKSQVICSSTLGDTDSFSSPAISLDIWLTGYEFTKVRGTFSFKSMGSLPAMDCSFNKVPLSNWDSDQRNIWIQQLGVATTLLTECPRMTDSTIVQNVADCKSACEARPECNTIFVKKTDTSDYFYVADSDRMIDVCNLHRCPDPREPPKAPNAKFEIWSFVSSERSWAVGSDLDNRFYGGYVAFGTAQQVIHGGCAAVEGLILPDVLTVVTIPETELRLPSSVLKFQVSQYNAEARVRLQDVLFDIYMPYPDHVFYIEEPFTSPGNYLYREAMHAGGARAPIVYTSDGNNLILTRRDTSLSIFPIV